jgi:UDPglucose--hexose-1-phosphate uridylyltransferase
MDLDNFTGRVLPHPLGEAYIAQVPVDPHADNPTGGCDFCADLSAGRVMPGTRAWIRPHDFPAFVPPTGEGYSLIYSRDHDRSLADLTLPEAIDVIGLWQQIYRQLAPHYQCVLTWEVHGEVIGQNLRHPHGEALGLAFVPDTLSRELASVTRAQADGRLCLFCQELAAESGGPRAVLESKHWLAFIPEYARYPYEVHIIARAHLPNIAAVNDFVAIEELAAALLYIVRAYDSVFQAPMPYMLVLHQLADERFHLHVELLPVGRAPGKLKFAASGELGFGLWVNDSLPAAKAAELRECLPSVRLG